MLCQCNLCIFTNPEAMTKCNVIVTSTAKETGRLQKRKKKDRRKDKSHRRDGQKKGHWKGGKISRKDESPRRDRQKKDEWIGGKMSRKDENITGEIDTKRKSGLEERWVEMKVVCCKCTLYCKRKSRIKFEIKKQTVFSLNKWGA